jgi:hypothetical protein
MRGTEAIPLHPKKEKKKKRERQKVKERNSELNCLIS